MLFSIIKRPRSRRVFGLNLEGFRERGRGKIFKLAVSISGFVKAVFRYAIRKIRFAGVSTLLSAKFTNSFAIAIKAALVRRLIWSRGRLGRGTVSVIVMGVAFMVFMFGSVFSSSRLVVSQEINPDYLSNVTDIIPQRNIATTTIPESRKRTEAYTYTVAAGDTISDIGERFKVSMDAIKYVNGLTDNSVLKVGQEIVIPPVSGLIHAVEDGDTLASIAEKYDVAAQAIADFNYILDTSSLAVGTELVIPGAKIPAPIIVPVIPSQFGTSTVDYSPSFGWCIWPTTVRIITQYFSWYHNGLDIATPWSIAPPIFACSGGTIIRAGWDPWGLGLHVEIDHGNGYKTVYGHMGRIDVGYGQYVSQGETIGLMGSTGRSTGPHVHFTVKYNDVPQDPFSYVQ